MARFKVGDRVISKEVDSFGERGVIEQIDTDDTIFVNLGEKWTGHGGGVANHMNGWWFKPEELDLDKEYKVLEILRNAISKGVIGKTRV